MPKESNNSPIFIPSIQNSESSKTLQKRKRVTRACDECRKKKVKCDGQQPCIHCTVYSYDCTYDQPSNRKKTGADLHLVESKLRAAERVLHLLMPELDVFDANFNYDVFEELYSKFKNNDNSVRLDELAHKYKSQNVPAPSNSSSTSPPVSSVQKFKKQKLALPHPNVDGSIESKDGREIKIILPPKNIALELVTKSWASPCVLFRFYHRPSFIKDLDELYETDPENYTNKQNKFLPLAYSVMAVGALFSKKNGVDDNFLEDEGYRYFVAARKLIDITDARDLYAIQTIVMLILFLQCSARLSTCYSYIGVGLRSALREGLHRKLEHPSFNPIEVEIRKRIFWTIYKMDIYVNTMLGLPRSIATEDIDQTLPQELDDENITENGYLPQEDGKLSSSGIANCHTRLILILNSIVKNLYPINSNLRLISHEKVSEMELELRAWLSSLPKELIPGFDPPFQYYKANRLLHLAFLHVQIVLYRPFIHYISPKYTSQPNIDTLSIQRAKNCISVARTVVNLAQDMIKKNMLSGSYWFSIYTIFFSVACLVYYVHEVPYDEFHPNYIGIRSDAEAGREILTILKDSSMAASRTYNILNSLFEQLNRKTAYLHTQRQRQRDQQQQHGNTKQGYAMNTFSVPIAQNLVASIGQQARAQTAVANREGSDKITINTSTDPPSAAVPPNTQKITEASQQTNQFSNDSYEFNNQNTFDLKLEEKLNDFDHLANFDNFINPPDDPVLVWSQQQNQQQQNLQQQNQQQQHQQQHQQQQKQQQKQEHDLQQKHQKNQRDSEVGEKNLSKDGYQQQQSGQHSQPVSNPESFVSDPQDAYLPGIMDKLDMQIFGRFLPPYMLKRPNGKDGPGAKGSDLPTGLTSTSVPDDFMLDNITGLETWDPELEENDFGKFS